MMLLSAVLALAMQTAPDDPVRIVVKASAGDCPVLIDGVRVDQADLEARAIGWARSGRPVELGGDEQAPYRCIGGLIFALQKAHFGSYFSTDFSNGFRIRFAAVVQLSASRNCEISINGSPATFPDYERLAADWGRNQPEIHFQPHPEVQFECVDRVLAVLRAHNTTKLGFIGNEQYAEDGEEAE